MIIRVYVLRIEEDGTHVCQMATSPRAGHIINLRRGEARVLVEWEVGPGEALEIDDEVAQREGLM